MSLPVGKEYAKGILGVLLGAVAILSLGGRVPAPAQFVVAPGGNDGNPGTSERPFATLERARDAVRALKEEGKLPAEGAVIWVEEGLHQLDRPLDLSGADSGTEAGPLIIRARKAGKTRLVGARRIRPGDFRPVQDSAILDRLDPAARGHLLELDLGALGIRHTGPCPDVFEGTGGLIELYFDGRRMPLARYPNGGCMTMKKVLFSGDDRRGGVFEFRDERTKCWAKAVEEGLWLKGYWRVAWQNEAIRVASIDAAAGTVTLAQPVAGGIGSKYHRPGGSGKERYWAMNLLEETDRAGEWCVVSRSKKLYFWPPAAHEGAEILIADMDTPLVSMRDVHHVVLRGLVIEGSLGNGIEISGGTANRILGCTLRNVSGTGVLVNGGSGHEVRSCDLHALGGSGIELRGGDRKTLTPAGHVALNNHIHHYGEIRRVYSAAIDVGFRAEAVGMRVAHNLVHDSPHVGVLFGGNDHVLELNEVFRVCLVSNDMGGFYTSADWTSRGNIIRNNFVHHSPQAHGVYCDDGDSGDLIEGNVLAGVDAGVFIGGGHDNIARNNLFVGCRKAYHVDARGVSRGYNLQNRRMVGAVTSVNPRQPPWSLRYPEMMNLLEFHPELPTGDVFETNLSVQCGILLDLSGKKDQLQYVKIGVNLEVNADPGFQDAARLDYRLRPGAEVLRSLPGFRPIPFEKIGLFTDEDRPRLPSEMELDRARPVTLDTSNDMDPLNR